MPIDVPDTYLDLDTLPFPFCPGCGHGTILERLNDALVQRAVDPKKLVIVSDIGCAGLSDRYFATNAFHGLHGRSVTYATGIKLANPELDVVVLIGDGGCGIGGHHLINAARRNIGVTVLVFNNLNYGMTGGEHSVSTPWGAVTATTPLGQLERPMDICRTVSANGASFVARTTTFDAALPNLIAEAMGNDGFSLVDVWELCTAYFAPANRLSKKAMEQTLDDLGFATGVVHRDPRPEFSRAYRAQHKAISGTRAMAPHPLEPRFRSDLEAPLAWLVAGAAGKKVVSTAAALSKGGLLAGLWATQRSDYPVTVRTGFSLAEVILSPEEILYTGISRPDVTVALFPEGFAKVLPRIRGLGPEATVYLSADLPEVETAARLVRLDFSRAPGWERKKDLWTVMAVAVALHETGAYPLDAFRHAIGSRAKGGEEALRAIDAGLELA